jgi:Protein of unknown function (DUF1460)
MRSFASRGVGLLATAALVGCAGGPQALRVPVAAPKPWAPPAALQQVAQAQGLDASVLAALAQPPLHTLKPAQLDSYLRLLHAAEPDLRARVSTIARRFIGQPYELYLLGEFPFELTDPQPLFSLQASDCVVFVEHVYAMALSRSWAEFFWMLQRIRYRDGVIGVTTRNHYTEPDWITANRWLVSDLTTSLLPEAAVPYQMRVDRTAFFRDRYKLRHDVPVQVHHDSYLPYPRVAELLPQLKAGDLVAIISGQGGSAWASHVGLVVEGDDGERRLVHSGEPEVREERFQAFIDHALARDARNRASGKQRPVLLGFKLLRLNDQPEPPPMAPQPRPQSPT